MREQICKLEEEEEQTERFDNISKEEILSLGDRVKERVLGQEKAIDKIILAIQRASVGLRDPEQPIGSFLLTGPTGVGKTLLAKRLAEELTGNRDNIVRVDCSEYQLKHELSKLIGAPHGYIGYEQGGILTNAMKKKPFSVVLFDEIEKAHDQVYNLLLQIMDEGTLTSNTGLVVSFKHSVVLMTSNLGVAEAARARSEVGFEKVRELTDTDRMDAMEVALKKQFKPEFLNRLDAVSHFMPLEDEGVCKEIVVLELEMLLEHLYTNKELIVRYTPEVIEHIYNKGFDVKFGARPLKRAIRKYFANPLSGLLLVEDMEKQTTLIASMDNGKIVFKREIQNG
jgi:ATP-dependent Clp protease ATP-binding subunit ClpC